MGSTSQRLSERIAPRGFPLILVAVIVGVGFIVRHVEITTLLASFFGPLLEISEPSIRSAMISVPRFHEEFLQLIANQPMSRFHWLVLELKSRFISMDYKAQLFVALASVDASVIVPTLNEAKYLPRCLHALEHQDYDGGYEVIVVDGGSTDGSIQIAEDHGVRVVTGRFRPVGAARNEGARSARGRILAFIDADTIASSTWLAAIDEALHRPNVVGVTGPTLPCDGGTLDFFTYRFWTIYLQRFLLSMRMPHVIGFNCAYSREPFFRSQGFDETSVMSEDIQLAFKMRQYGKIVFDKHVCAWTSARRFHKFGRSYISGLYLVNGVTSLLMNKSYHNYPPVR